MRPTGVRYCALTEQKSGHYPGGGLEEGLQNLGSRLQNEQHNLNIIKQGCIFNLVKFPTHLIRGIQKFHLY